MDLLRANSPLWKRFTGMEEYDPAFTDEYGRFPHYASNQADIMSPTVSKFLVDHGVSFEYPNGKPYALCLTHDVDLIRTTWFGVAEETARALRGRDFRRAGETVGEAIRSLDGRQDPCRNFAEIIRLEEKYGAKSTFYFLARRFWDDGWTYDVERLTDEIRDIVRNGWGVGLHGSPTSIDDLPALREERARLEACAGKRVVGYRSHYLRFQVPTTWENLARTGFEYDTSYGTPYCVGFRNGMCHPFQPYNILSNRLASLLEIPLQIMDFSFARYMHVSERIGWEITKKIINSSRALGGVTTILWHNNYMPTFGEDFYRRILEFGAENDAWMTSAEELCAWWRNQRYTNWQESRESYLA